MSNLHPACKNCHEHLSMVLFETAEDLLLERTMETINPYDFFLEVKDSQGGAGYQEIIDEDTFSLLIDDALFSAICAGRPSARHTISKARIAPVWKEEAASAYISGLSVEVCWNGQHDDFFSKLYGIEPFRLRARQGIRTLFERRLQQRESSHGEAGDAEKAAEGTFTWKVSAFPKPERPREPEIRKFRAMAVDSAFVIPEEPIASFGLAFPDGSGQKSYTVFIPNSVVEEIQRLTLQTEGRLEQAGFLIGHVARDPDAGRVYAVATAHLPASEGVEAGMDSFTFSPETFMQVRRFIELRGRGEACLGWQHNHHFCPGCPFNPSGSTIFFSTADEQVQAASFRLPYMVALVAGRDLELEPKKPAVRMFGWEDAQIVERRLLRYETKGQTLVVS
ncbi:MAG: hypothetical protein L0387_29875 [Acidobacteria bacterium]|nr:hypothetical protein [Acidobacteriota bacterium]MCI0721409.1 hypothetical protein [Acidobacteriota bacterium]